MSTLLFFPALYSAAAGSVRSILTVGLSCLGFVSLEAQDLKPGNAAGFKPDTSINGLALRSEATLSRFYAAEISLRPGSGSDSYPAAYFYNVSSTQYLAVYHYNGDAASQFSLFEIGYRDQKKTDTLAKVTAYGFFQTESGIKLGISKKELLKIKGEPLSISEKELRQVEGAPGNAAGEMPCEVISYALYDPVSAFLKRYRMPSYFASYYISNNRVVKLRFGFDYP